jgi:hypothetical protein
MVLPFFSPLRLDFWTAGPEETKNPAGQKKCPTPDSDPFNDAEFGKNLRAWQDKLLSAKRVWIEASLLFPPWIGGRSG